RHARDGRVGDCMEAVQMAMQAQEEQDTDSWDLELVMRLCQGDHNHCKATEKDTHRVAGKIVRKAANDARKKLHAIKPAVAKELPETEGDDEEQVFKPVISKGSASLDIRLVLPLRSDLTEADFSHWFE